MATRSRIGIVNEDGTVSSIYCHWDGYLSHNGKILIEHYQDRDKVKALVGLGSISFLRSEVDPPAIWDDMPEGRAKNLVSRMFPRDTHSFDNPAPNVTVAYHRDRGEDLVIAKYESVNEYFENDFDEFGYLFTLEGEWVYQCIHDENRVTRPVSEVLADN